MLESQKIAWAAGLFEGEGCISIAYRHDGAYVALRLAMVDGDVVERFARIVGAGHTGKLKTQANHHQAQTEWRTARKDDVHRVLEMFLPLLGERRAAKAREALPLLVYKGAPRGERHPLAKLREQDIPRIRERLIDESQTAVAADYGVSRKLISNIAAGRSWSHV